MNQLPYEIIDGHMEGMAVPDKMTIPPTQGMTINFKHIYPAISNQGFTLTK